MKTPFLKHSKRCPVLDQVAQATFALGLSDAMKYAVAVRVLAGNGLTVIANIGNPAGGTILARSFPSGGTPLGLLGRRWRLRQSLAW
jgi:hypothetical protein